MQNIIVSPLNDEFWILKEDLDIEGYKVPKGFITNFASAPRLFWVIIPPWCHYGRASILHDYYYCNGELSRKEADDLFLKIMKIDKVKFIKKYLIYFTIRVFGWVAYNNNQKRKKETGYCNKIFEEVYGKKDLTK